jgi:hypothetical protein
MAPINRLCRHSFKECSDLPPLRPIFSCDACDKWRARVHSVHYKDRSSLIRSELSARYQCSRIKKGYNPIRIRIICNPEVNICEPDKDIRKEPPEPQCLTSIEDFKPSRKRKIQRKGSSKTYKLDEAKKVRAKLIIEKLISVDNSNEKLKEKDQEYLAFEKEHNRKLKEKDQKYFALEKENFNLKDKLDFTERKLKSAKVLVNHYIITTKKKYL